MDPKDIIREDELDEEEVSMSRYWYRNPKEMTREDWLDWADVFADVQEWIEEGRLEKGMSYAELTGILPDLVFRDEGWNLDDIPEDIWDDVVDRIFKALNED